MTFHKNPDAPTALRGDIREQILASIAATQALLADDRLLGQLERLAQACLGSLRSGGKIIFCGNGGSFADAQHLAAEFTSRFRFDRRPLASLALGTNSSAMSAVGNDYGFDQVFSRELESIVQPSDVVIAITTSGNSPNVIAAVEVAKRAAFTTIGWTGASGGRLKDVCECIAVPTVDTARIQECHILIGHVLCGLVESSFFPRPPGPG